MKNMFARTTQHEGDHDGEDKGFTLVEILIAIVLVGILSAVVIVGIANLTSSGSKSACAASADAAKAGTIVYYASHGNTFPTNFTQLTTASVVATADVPAALTLPTGAAVSATPFLVVTQGTNWTMTMTPGALGAAPTFACT